jgi:hypothetical protein
MTQSGNYTGALQEAYIGGNFNFFLVALVQHFVRNFYVFKKYISVVENFVKIKFWDAL